MRRSQTRILLWFALVTVTFAVPAFMSMHTGDDLGYMFADTVHHGGDGTRVTTLGQCIDTQAHHYVTTNGRFAVHVTVMALLNLMPLWLFRTLNAVMFGLLWLLTVRLSTPAGQKPGNTRCAVAWLLLWLCLPQPGLVLLTLVAYAVNYLWVTVAAAAFMLALKRGLTPWILCPAAFAVGTLHEGFSLPLCAAVLVSVVLTRRNIAVFVCLVAGTAVCVFAPGNMAHAAQGGGLGAAALYNKLTALGFDLLVSPAAWLGSAAIGWGIWRLGRKFFADNYFLLTVIGSALLLACVTFTSPRQLTFPFWCIALLVLRTAPALSGRALTVAAACTALLTAGTVTALKYPVYQRYSDFINSAGSTDAIVYPHGVRSVTAPRIPTVMQRALAPDPLLNIGLVSIGDKYTRNGLERLRPGHEPVKALLPAAPAVLVNTSRCCLKVTRCSNGMTLPNGPYEKFSYGGDDYIITADRR